MWELIGLFNRDCYHLGVKLIEALTDFRTRKNKVIRFDSFSSALRIVARDRQIDVKCDMSAPKPIQVDSILLVRVDKCLNFTSK